MVMAPSLPELGTLRARWRDAVSRATPGRPILVSVGVTLPAVDPLDLFAHVAGTARDRFYWERPADGVAFAGVGAAWTVESASPVEAGRAWRALLAEAVVRAPSFARDAEGAGGGGDAPDAMDGPLLTGGFAFDPLRPATTLWAGYPAGRLTLPRLTLVTRGGRSTLTVNAVAANKGAHDHDIDALIGDVEDMLAVPAATRAPGSLVGRAGARVEDALSRAGWEALVAGGVRACREGALRKVVLARSARMYAPVGAGLDVTAALRFARETYPNAYTFAVAHDEGTFLGATPERLARLHDGVADVACLAGSTARGATPEEDRARGDLLLASPKDRAEHRFVVDAVRAALADVCPDLQVPAAPRLLRLQNVQHLYTPVTGRVAAGKGLLDLVARLHPTPAVGGQPREEALAYIRAHEDLDRGWYAAPVGWLNSRGEGEFAVALRSALVRGDRATLFAGCGIVAGSSPAAEYEETRLKLRPMLAALGARQGATET